MTLRVARFTNLLLASILTGNEVGTLVAVHPALHSLPTPVHIQAEQAITRRYGPVMPVLMSSVVFSCFPVLGLTPDRQSAAFRFTLAGTTCFAAMLGVTLLGNMPINSQILQMSLQSPPADWLELRARWERLHLLRIFFDVTG